MWAPPSYRWKNESQGKRAHGEHAKLLPVGPIFVAGHGKEEEHHGGKIYSQGLDVHAGCEGLGEGKRKKDEQQVRRNLDHTTAPSRQFQQHIHAVCGLSKSALTVIIVFLCFAHDFS